MSPEKIPIRIGTTLVQKLRFLRFTRDRRAGAR